MPSTRALKTRIRSVFSSEILSANNHTRGIDTLPPFDGNDRYARAAWLLSPDSERYKSNCAQEWFEDTVAGNGVLVANMYDRNEVNAEDVRIARFMTHEAMAAIARATRNLDFKNGFRPVDVTLADLHLQDENKDRYALMARRYAETIGDVSQIPLYTVLGKQVVSRTLACRSDSTYNDAGLQPGASILGGFQNA